MACAHNDIDPEDVASWPRLTHSWAEACADRLAGSTVHVGDLAISPEQEDEFRRTFGPSKLVLYHNTRLLPHEVQDIRSVGLRLLDEKLVEDRIRLAIAHGALTGAARRCAETGNIYAISNLAGRERRVCFVAGRTCFDESPHGCIPLLSHWGGEAIRGGPQDVPALATIGTPSIVVARVNLTRPHNDPYSWPGLANLFVGKLLGLRGRCADILYPDDISGRDIIDIWQPGHPDYDRHPALPR